MSFMHFDATTAASVSGFVVNLDGNPTLDVLGTLGALAGWNFTNVGFVQTVTNFGTNTIDASTDWITPLGHDPADYEVRGFITSSSSTKTVTHPGANAFEGNGPGDWYGLATTRKYRYQITTSFQNEFASASIRFEIRNITDLTKNIKISQNDGTTPIIDDGEYSYTLEVGLE